MDEHAAFYLEAEFWVLIAFVIFLIAVGRRAAQIGATMLDRHSEMIRAQIEEARTLREEAQTRLADAKRRQREATREADEIVARARAEAERHRAQAETGLQASLQRRRDQALDKIAQAEADAVRQVRQQAAGLAVAAARTVIAEDLTGDRGDRLIEQSIAELPGRMH